MRNLSLISLNPLRNEFIKLIPSRRCLQSRSEIIRVIIAIAIGMALEYLLVGFSINSDREISIYGANFLYQ